MHPWGPPFSLNVAATSAEAWADGMGVVDVLDTVDAEDAVDIVDMVSVSNGSG